MPWWGLLLIAAWYLLIVQPPKTVRSPVLRWAVYLLSPAIVPGIIVLAAIGAAWLQATWPRPS